VDLLEQETVSGDGISWVYAILTPDLLQDLSLRVTHEFTSSPIVHTCRVPPCMLQSRLGDIPRWRRELYLLPASRASILNPLDHRELCLCCCHQCLCRTDCTSSQVQCIPSQPDRLVTQLRTDGQIHQGLC